MGASYTLSEVRRIVGVPLSLIRRFVSHGFVSPSRGARREYLFGFQDLVVLRMAKALADASVSNRRIGSSLKRLRKKLPDALPLTGLRITAVGSDVVVVERESQWRADDGQYLLALEVTGDGDALTFEQPPKAVHDWFAQAYALEELSPEDSMAYYERALEDDSCLAGAYANLGRLLHEAGRLREAEAVYNRGDKACDEDAVLLYNFALLREDQERWEDAIALYRRALGAEPGMEDAHYNLALLFHSQRREREAVRHFSAYRKLTAER